MARPRPTPALVEEALGAPVAKGAPEVLAGFALTDMLPQVAVFPETPEQVAALLALAGQEGWAVLPWGGGSGVGAGGAPARYDVALSLSRLAGVIDFDPENLTLTAAAGLTVQEANRRMRPHRQFLPLGLPGDKGTLGGIIAANRPVPLRLLYGDLRDLLLSVRVALPDGRLVRYGRKVIKNVAGYDMNKLFLGSRGVLGVIVEATFRLYALPDRERWLVGSFPAVEAAASAAAGLWRSPLQPACLLLLTGAAPERFRKRQGLPPPSAAVELVVGFEGRSEPLRRQEADCRHIFSDHAAHACEGADGLTDGAAAVETLGMGHAAVAEFSAGAIHLELAGMQGTQSARVADWMLSLRERLRRVRGFVSLHRASPELTACMPGWGAREGEAEIMERLVAEINPARAGAPERFLARP
ncbi:MAG: FAD-binding oxidoreductase [SAR324 cluster bacterium]|nr:FAD-binding oxidoreductase [SAR324 cluster bacterium]